MEVVSGCMGGDMERRTDLDITAGIEKDVVALDVAVDDVLTV